MKDTYIFQEVGAVFRLYLLVTGIKTLDLNLIRGFLKRSWFFVIKVFKYSNELLNFVLKYLIFKICFIMLTVLLKAKNESETNSIVGQQQIFFPSANIFWPKFAKSFHTIIFKSHINIFVNLSKLYLKAIELNVVFTFNFTKMSGFIL